MILQSRRRSRSQNSSCSLSLAAAASSASWFLFLLLSCQVAAAAPEPLRLYGINYNNRQGPDWDANKCKNYAQVLADLTALRGLTNRVRILSLSDCAQGQYVLKAAKTLDMQVLMGLWVSDDETVFGTELATLQMMLDAGDIDAETVVGVTVGSEAVYRDEVTADTIASYQQQVKQAMVEAGLADIPVSICDIDDVYIEFPQLFNNGDQVVVNSFPFWESQEIDAAVTYLENEMEPVFARANGKPYVLGETGWPSGGTSDQTSVPSPENQIHYLVDFYCRMDRQLGWAYYYFTGIDNDWRSAQDGQVDTVESHFGLLNPDLTLKSYLVDFSFSCPDSDVEYSIQLGTAASNPTEPTPTATDTTTTSTPTVSAVTAPAPTEPAPAPVTLAPVVASTPTRPAPTTRAPTRRSPTTSAPTVPLSSPTDSANDNASSSKCSAHSQCAAKDLQGQCCPTSDGTFLLCCSSSGGGGVKEDNIDDTDDNVDDDADVDLVPTAMPTVSAGFDPVPAVDRDGVTMSLTIESTMVPDTDASDVPSASPTFADSQPSALDTTLPSGSSAPTPTEFDWGQDRDSNAIQDDSGALSVGYSMVAMVGSLVVLFRILG